MARLTNMMPWKWSLAAAKSEKKEDRKDRKTKDTDDSAERANGEMDFEKYMHAPTPGPVVDRKYRKYILASTATTSLRWTKAESSIRSTCRDSQMR